MSAVATSARERPIIFSGPMIRAILDGRKTQTRRLLKSEPRGAVRIVRIRHGEHRGSFLYLDFDGAPGLSWRPYGGASTQPYPNPEYACPYGVPGDRLWVRETWGAADQFYQSHELDEPRVVAYAADRSALDFSAPAKPAKIPAWDLAQWNWDSMKWSSPIHMPRWASRLALEVAGVSVERLQSITEDDARAEGIDPNAPIPARINGEPGTVHCFGPDAARRAFALGWDALNGQRASWASNPFVWCISFRRYL